MIARLGPRFYLTAVVKESGESLVGSLWHGAEIVEYVCNDGNMPTHSTSPHSSNRSGKFT